MHVQWRREVHDDEGRSVRRQRGEDRWRSPPGNAYINPPTRSSSSYLSSIVTLIRSLSINSYLELFIKSPLKSLSLVESLFEVILRHGKSSLNSEIVQLNSVEAQVQPFQSSILTPSAARSGDGGRRPPHKPQIELPKGHYIDRVDVHAFMQKKARAKAKTSTKPYFLVSSDGRELLRSDTD